MLRPASTPTSGGATGLGWASPSAGARPASSQQPFRGSPSPTNLGTVPCAGASSKPRGSRDPLGDDPVLAARARAYLDQLFDGDERFSGETAVSCYTAALNNSLDLTVHHGRGQEMRRARGTSRDIDLSTPASASARAVSASPRPQSEPACCGRGSANSQPESVHKSLPACDMGAPRDAERPVFVLTPATRRLQKVRTMSSIATKQRLFGLCKAGNDSGTVGKPAGRAGAGDHAAAAAAAAAAHTAAATAAAAAPPKRSTAKASAAVPNRRGKAVRIRSDFGRTPQEMMTAAERLKAEGEKAKAAAVSAAAVRLQRRIAASSASGCLTSSAVQSRPSRRVLDKASQELVEESMTMGLPKEVVTAVEGFGNRHTHWRQAANSTLTELSNSRDFLDPVLSRAFNRRLLEVRRNRLQLNDPSPEEVREFVRRKQRRVARKKWNVHESIWLPRKLTGNAKDFYETPAALKRTFNADWGITSIKLAKTFSRMGLDQDDINTAAAMLCSQCDAIYDAFDYYAVLSTQDGIESSDPDVHNVSFNGYLQMVLRPAPSLHQPPRPPPTPHPSAHPPVPVTSA